jgi:SMC interacting uncharacterized protein involved in chromosome segregation
MLQVFLGTYSQYRARQEAEKAEADARNRAVIAAQKVKAPLPSPEERRRRNRIKEVESQIVTLEEQLSALGRRLENPPADPVKVQKLGGEYVQVQGELERLMAEWEGLQAA